MTGDNEPEPGILTKILARYGLSLEFERKGRLHALLEAVKSILKRQCSRAVAAPMRYSAAEAKTHPAACYCAAAKSAESWTHALTHPSDQD